MGFIFDRGLKISENSRKYILSVFTDNDKEERCPQDILDAFDPLTLLLEPANPTAVSQPEAADLQVANLTEACELPEPFPDFLFSDTLDSSAFSVKPTTPVYSPVLSSVSDFAFSPPTVQPPSQSSALPFSEDFQCLVDSSPPSTEISTSDLCISYDGLAEDISLLEPVHCNENNLYFGSNCVGYDPLACINQTQTTQTQGNYIDPY